MLKMLIILYISVEWGDFKSMHNLYNTPAVNGRSFRPGPLKTEPGCK